MELINKPLLFHPLNWLTLAAIAIFVLFVIHLLSTYHLQLQNQPPSK